jgi:hypothetical protein
MSIRRTFLAAAAAAGLMVGAVAPAGAHLVRPVSSFVAGGITDPLDVAVEQSTGEVFVTGLASGDVEKYSPSGTPEPSFVSPKLVEPWGVAVDNSTGASKGDVYVADVGASVVYKLYPSGQPVAGFTTIEAASIPSGDPGSENFSPHGVAVDPTNGNVVVEDEANAETDIFNSSGVFVSQFAGGAVGVAVGSGSDIFTSGGEGVQRWSAADGYTSHTTIDPTGDFAVAVNLSSGDVLSDDGGSIAEYEAFGDPLSQFGAGQLSFSAGVTVDEATNTVYATDVFSGNVYIFGAPFRLPDVITSASSTNPTATTATLSGTVNPDTTSVTGCRFEYGTTTSYGASLGCSQALPLTGTTPLPASLSLSGLQANETYHYRLDASNSNGTSFGADQIFTTSPAPPTLDEQSASGLTQTSAILNASINPNNEPTTYHFEYGANIEYGAGVPIPEQTIGAGSGDVVVGQPLTGLQPGTTYHFRVIAINATGVSTGEDQTFRTSAPLPPIVETQAAVNLTQNAVTLAGAVDSRGVATTYEFDIGADTTYGSRVFGEAGSSSGSQTFTATLQGLAAATTYHYRILATNIYGTTYGADSTFTTPGFLTTTLTAPATATLIPTPPFQSPATNTTSTKPPNTKRDTTKKKPVKHKHKAKRATNKSTKSNGSKRRQG